MAGLVRSSRCRRVRALGRPRGCGRCRNDESGQWGDVHRGVVLACRTASVSVSVGCRGSRASPGTRWRPSSEVCRGVVRRVSGVRPRHPGCCSSLHPSRRPESYTNGDCALTVRARLPGRASAWILVRGSHRDLSKVRLAVAVRAPRRSGGYRARLPVRLAVTAGHPAIGCAVEVLAAR